jgi:hypothetical protein
MSTANMLATPAQQSVLDSCRRFHMVTAGRRFGKTRLGILKLKEEAHRNPGDYVHISPTRPMAENIAWPERLFICNDGTAKEDCRGVANTFYLANGSRIHFFHAGCERTLLSQLSRMDLRGIVVDEFPMQPKWLLRDIPAAGRKENNVWAFLAGTLPWAGYAVTANEARDLARYFRAMSNKHGSSYGYDHFTSLQGDNISPLHVRDAYMALPSHWFAWEYGWARV